MDAARVASHPFLTGLPDDEIAEVARVAAERRFQPGDDLVTEGEFGHAVFLVEDGEGEVSADGRPIRAVKAGDVVGEVAVLSSGRRLDRLAPEAAQRFRAALGERIR
jgi:CRP-like cAMP-binding protein